MSTKSEQPRENTRDIFAACKSNVDRYFNGIKQSVPQYHQSITNVQQECLQACENMVNSAINIQKEFTKKAGISSHAPDAALKVIHDTTEEVVKAYSLQSQITLAAIDATQQNIKTFNDNAKSFGDLNRNILQSWLSTIAPIAQNN